MTATHRNTKLVIATTSNEPAKAAVSLEIHPETYRVICAGARAARLSVADFIVTTAYRSARTGEFS